MRFALVFSTLIQLLIFDSQTSLGQCRSKGDRSYSELYDLSKDERVDRILIKYLNDFEDEFGIDAEIFIYNDSRNTNAKAIHPPIVNKNSDGTILMGLNLMKELEKEYIFSDETIVGVLGHELGHVVQYAWNSDLEGDEAELQADFLAGWLLGRIRGFYNFEVVNSFFEIGDFHDPSHHGTKVEREYCFSMGIRYAGLSASSAYKKSFQIVEDLIEDTGDVVYIFCPRCKGHENRNEVPGYYKFKVCSLCAGMALIPKNTKEGRNRSRHVRSRRAINGYIPDREKFLDNGCCVKSY